MFSPDPVAFSAALTATAKVFLMGFAGYFLVWRGLLKPDALVGFSSLVANLTLPCLIFHRFSAQFDPQTFPHWWVILLAGAALQCFQIALGWVLSRRLKPENGRDEYVMLLGFQNAGFFVLPMLQALLPPAEFDRATVWLFVFIIFFNAALWPLGTRVLLKERGFNFKKTLFSPPLFWTIVALICFGPLHDWFEILRPTMVWKMFLGGTSPGAIELLGDLTVPLATLILGASIGQTAQNGWRGFAGKTTALELNFWKLFALPLLGLLLIEFWPTSLFQNDRSLRLLVMLQFSAPVAVNVAVFCQQFGYPMRLIPATSLVSYALCVFTVPFWVALVL